MSVFKDYPIDTGRSIKFIADNVRRERTGTHATVTIGIDTTLLAWTNFNVERDEERTRLANSAHKELGQLDAEAYRVSDMKHHLALFCRSLWNEHVAQSIEVEDAAPDEEEAPPEYAIEPYLPMETGAILFGPRGMGKSATLMLMAVQLDSGTAGTFAIPYRRPVLFINLERSRDSILRRLRRINLLLGLAANRPMKMINARGRSLTDVAPRAKRAVDGMDRPVVFVDSLSRAGIELTKDDAANAMIDILNGFGTWQAIAHEPKNAQKPSVFGSSMFENAADVVVHIEAQKKDESNELGLCLKVTKANDIRFPKPRIFAFRFDDWGVVGVRDATDREFEEFSGRASQGELAETLVTYLGEVGKATMSEAAEELETTRQRLIRITQTDKRIIKLPKDGRKQYFGVIDKREDWAAKAYG